MQVWRLFIDKKVKGIKMTMEIPKEELIASLEAGYTEYKRSKDAGTNQIDLAKTRGFCNAIEQILAAYGETTVDDILKIREPILGPTPLRKKSNESIDTEVDPDADLDLPTILRRQK